MPVLKTRKVPTTLTAVEAKFPNTYKAKRGVSKGMNSSHVPNQLLCLRKSVLHV